LEGVLQTPSQTNQQDVTFVGVGVGVDEEDEGCSLVVKVMVGEIDVELVATVGVIEDEKDSVGVMDEVGEVEGVIEAVKELEAVVDGVGERDGLP